MLDLAGNAYFENAGHTKNADDDFQLSLYESYGRWRLDASRKLNPTLGYRFLYLDLDNNSPVLPRRLVDQSIGFGTPFAQIESGWFFALTVGLGYAGNSPFGDANGWYGKGTLIMGKELGEDETLVFGLSYDGNRSIFPDFPVPGFAYTKRLDPTLLAVVGFPFSSIRWEPADTHLTLELMYTIPDRFEAQARYQVAEHVQVFADYTQIIEGFHIDGDVNTRRILFHQQRAEAGVRVEPVPGVGLIAAVGYAFGQEFNRGFDTRDEDRLASVSDEGYLRFGIEVRP